MTSCFAHPEPSPLTRVRHSWSPSPARRPGNRVGDCSYAVVDVKYVSLDVRKSKLSDIIKLLPLVHPDPREVGWGSKRKYMRLSMPPKRLTMLWCTARQAVEMSSSFLTGASLLPSKWTNSKMPAPMETMQPRLRLVPQICSASSTPVPHRGT
jgi:hypothetical protein